MEIIVPAIAGAVLVLIVFLFTKGKIGEGSRWGLNLKGSQACPSCGAAIPVFRKPANKRQALWGGWTCPGCGVELDKWLKPVGDENKEA